MPDGRQHESDLGEPRALPPIEAGGPPEGGRPAIPPAEGLVERGTRHCQALGDVLQGRQPPPWLRAHVRPLEEASQAKEAGDRPLEGVQSAGEGLEGPFIARVAGGGGGSAQLTWARHKSRAGAGSLRATQRRVCCSQVRRRLRETGCGPRRPIRYGDSGGTALYRGYAMPRRGILLAVCAVQSERGDTVPTYGGGGFCAGMTRSTTVVAPCPNIRPGWPCPWPCVRPRRVGPVSWGGGGAPSWPPRSGLAPRLPHGSRRALRYVPLIILCGCCFLCLMARVVGPVPSPYAAPYPF